MITSKNESAALTESMRRTTNMAGQIRVTLADLGVEISALDTATHSLRERVKRGEKVPELQTLHGARIVRPEDKQHTIPASESLAVTLRSVRLIAADLDKADALLTQRRAEVAKLLSQ